MPLGGFHVGEMAVLLVIYLLFVTISSLILNLSSPVRPIGIDFWIQGRGCFFPVFRPGTDAFNSRSGLLCEALISVVLEGILSCEGIGFALLPAPVLPIASVEDIFS